MKAAPFEYYRASSIEDACRALASHGDDAKLIAGGQSLVPMMAMRLVRPAWLVDIDHLEALRTVASSAASVRIGAGLRQATAERDEVLSEAVPLMRKALGWVGHIQTRNRGTIGGSLAHADPAAELPVVTCLLEATMHLRSIGGERSVAAQIFFDGPMSTVIAADECLEAVSVPVWTDGVIGCAFDEISIRHGDFAIVAAAAQVALDAAGRCRRAAIGIGGAGPTPLAFVTIAARLVGTRLDDDSIAAAATDVAAASDPGQDLHASVAYRRHLARVLVTRTLRAARDEARGKTGLPARGHA